MAEGFQGGSVVNSPPANAGDTGLISGSGRSPEEGNGNLLRYSWLGNPMDRRACQAPVHGITKESDTTEQLNNNNNNMAEDLRNLHIGNPFSPLL